MDAERKQTYKTVKELRSALAEGDIQRFQRTLETQPTHSLLKAIREQKLLVKNYAAEHELVVEIVRTVASTVLCSKELEEYSNYLSFIGYWQKSKESSESRLKSCFNNFPKVSIEELLQIFDKALYRFFSKLPYSAPKENQTVADYEKSIHHRNGIANDVLFAALRALNDASRKVVHPSARKLSPSTRLSSIRRFYKAVQLASEVNSLDWIMDSVSYGDLVVSKLQTGSPIEARLEYADKKRSLMLNLAIRRKLIGVMHLPRNERYVREMLKASETSVLTEALEFYAGFVNENPSQIDMESLLRQSSARLAQVEAEDDLLMVASARAGKQNPATYYLTSMCLTWFGMAADAVQKAFPRSFRRRSSVPIPSSLIESAVSNAGGKQVAETIKELSSTLPTKSHQDLVGRPFLSVSEDDTLWLLNGDPGLWNLKVREALLSGGKVGDAYGHVWEEFLAKSFEDSDWQLIGRNKRLRLAGHTATEVDLLLKKNDLLLVVEVKAQIGSSITCYDHWRSRQTVEWGCRQAAAAAEFIKSNENWLISVAGKRLAEEVRHIQPLVLTNNDLLDGWHFEGVPVMGEVGRKAITTGAKVDYTDQSGRVVSTRWITRKEELTTDRILWSLQNPVELLIAPESLETSHRVLKLGDFAVLTPQFDLRDDLESVPAIAVSS